MDSYLIGFIASDGHNAGSYWTITQTISGIDVFNKLKHRYGYSYREVSISEWGKQRKFTMKYRNKLQCKYLVDWGIPIGNKTYSLSFPMNKPHDEIWHYLRGMFDGDGSFSIENNKYGRIQIISNVMCCNSCSVFLSKYNIDSHISIDRRHSGISTIYIKKLESIKLFFSYLYNNCYIYMARKYNKWNYFMNVREYYEYTRELKDRQQKHLESISSFNFNTWKPCLHDSCSDCHGTGIKLNGGICWHALSCDCPKCRPMSSTLC